MSNPSIPIAIRAKKLGVLMVDARHTAKKSQDECARALGIPADTLADFELGERSPTLPQLEVLAYYLNIPLEHFWGNKAVSEDHTLESSLDLDQLISLRQRMVGAMVRQARLESDLSLEEVAASVSISSDDLEACELGELELPLPVLEALGKVFDRPIEGFMDDHGPVGAWVNQQRAIQDFLSLPDEMQMFVTKPINRPYLELAQRLSEMSVDKLRSVGEGILEITL